MQKQTLNDENVTDISVCDAVAQEINYHLICLTTSNNREWDSFNSNSHDDFRSHIRSHRPDGTLVSPGSM